MRELSEASPKLELRKEDDHARLVVIGQGRQLGFYVEHLEVDLGKISHELILTKYRNRRGKLRVATLRIEPRALFNLTSRRQTILSEHSFFRSLVETRNGHVLCQTELANGACLSFTVALLPEGVDLVLSVTNPVVWGRHSQPSPLLAHHFLEALLGNFLELGILQQVGLGIFRWSPLDQLLRTTFPTRGLRIPKRKHLQFVSLRVLRSGIEWIYGSDAHRRRTLDARRKLAAQDATTPGDSLLLQGKLAEATKAYFDVLERKSKDGASLDGAVAERLLAIAATNHPAMTNASQFAAQMRARTVGKSAATLALASLAIANKQYSKSVALYRTMGDEFELGRDPDSTEMSKLQAIRCAIAGDDYDDAKRMARQLLDSKVVSAFGHPILSACLMELNDWAGCKRLLHRRLSSMINAESRVNLALELLPVAKRVDASGRAVNAHLQEVLKLSSDEFDLQLKVAQAALDWGAAKMAQDICSHILETAQRGADRSLMTQARTLLARSLTAQKRYDDALAEIDQASENSNADDVLRSKAEIRAAQGDFREAQRVLGQVGDQLASDRLQMAEYALANHQDDRAQEIASGLVEAPDQITVARALSIMAKLAIRTGEDKKALDLWDEALDVLTEQSAKGQPLQRLEATRNLAGVALLRAKALHKANRLDDAFADLEQAYSAVTGQDGYQACRLAWQLFEFSPSSDRMKRLHWLDEVLATRPGQDMQHRIALSRAQILFEHGNKAGAVALLDDAKKEGLSDKVRREFRHLLEMPQGAGDEDVASTLQRARACLHDGDRKAAYALALAAWQQAQQQDADDALLTECLRVRCDAAIALRDWPQVLESFEELQERGYVTKDASFYYGIGVALTEQSELKKALEQLQHAVTLPFESQTDLLDAWRLLVRLAELAVSDDFIKILEDAARHDSLPAEERASMWHRCGEAHMTKRGDLAMAEKCFWNAEELCPDFLPALDALEKLYTTHHRPAKLEKVLHTKASIVANIPEQHKLLLSRLGDIQLELSKDQEAENNFRAALKHDPKFRPALVGLSALTQDSAGKTQAIPTLKLLASFLPSDGALTETKGDKYVSDSREKAAIALAQQSGDDKETKAFLQAVRKQAGQSAYGELLDRLLQPSPTQDSVDEEPRTTVKLLEEAWQALRDKKLVQAAAKFDHLKRNAQLTPSLLDELEKAFLALDDLDELSEILKLRADLAEDDKSKAAALAKLCKHYRDIKHDEEKAYDTISEAWKLCPDNSEIAYTLKNLAMAGGHWSIVADVIKSELNFADSDEEAAASYCELGMVLEEKLNLDEAAIEALEKALELDPTIAAAKGHLALLYSRQGNYPQAVDMALMAANAITSECDTWKERAVAWAKKSSSPALRKRAITEQGRGNSSASPSHNLDQLVLRLDAPDEDEQLAAATQILQESPGHVRALQTASDILLQRGEYRKAAQLLEPNLDSISDGQQRTHFSEIFADLCETKLHDQDKAVKVSELVLDHNPKHVRSIERVANSAFHKGDWQRAASLYSGMHPKDTTLDNAERLYRVGVCYEALGYDRKALTALKDAAKSGEVSHISALARAAERCEDYRVAIDALQELLAKTDPDDSTSVIHANLRLGDLHRKAGDLAAAVKYYESVLDNDHRNRPALSALVELNNERRNYRDAALYLEELTAIAPSQNERADLLIQLADAQMSQLKDLHGALSSLEQAADIRPEDTEILLRLIELYWRKQRFEDVVTAAQEVRSCGSLNPDAVSPSQLGAILVSAAIREDKILTQALSSSLGTDADVIFDHAKSLLAQKEPAMANKAAAFFKKATS